MPLSEPLSYSLSFFLVYVDGKTKVSSYEHKTTLQEFYVTLYPSLQQLEGAYSEDSDDPVDWIQKLQRQSSTDYVDSSRGRRHITITETATRAESRCIRNLSRPPPSKPNGIKENYLIEDDEKATTNGRYKPQLSCKRSLGKVNPSGSYFA